MSLNSEQEIKIQNILNKILEELENKKTLVLYELSVVEKKIEEIKEIIKIFENKKGQK